jgi:hypothetical protein
VWVSGVTIASLTLVTAFGTDEKGNLLDVPNVLEGLRPLAKTLEPAIFLLPLCLLASAASLVVRFRRAQIEERQQLKWVAFAAGVVAAWYAIVFAASMRFDSGQGPTPPLVSFLQSATLSMFAVLPIAVGIAVLRYRLYDIDRLISRTLSYAAVTAVLAGIYALVVLGPLSVASSGRRPQWLVAVGTLAAAAVASPVRRRVQAAVDHRFDRRKYDAVRTVDAFADRMRRQIDLDDLGAELADLVRSTMQPSHLSIWLPASPVASTVTFSGRSPGSTEAG